MVSVPCYNAFTLYRFTLYVVFIFFLAYYVKNRKEFTTLFNGKIKFILNIITVTFIYCISFSINLTPAVKKEKGF